MNSVRCIRYPYMRCKRCPMRLQVFLFLVFVTWSARGFSLFRNLKDLSALLVTRTADDFDYFVAVLVSVIKSFHQEFAQRYIMEYSIIRLVKFYYHDVTHSQIFALFGILYVILPKTLSQCLYSCGCRNSSTAIINLTCQWLVTLIDPQLLQPRFWEGNST